MANKSLTDLSSRSSTDDADLLHVNSGGTDYKQTKQNLFADAAQKTTFNVSSTLLSQIDALPKTNKEYYGFISSNGYQTPTGVPLNYSFYVDAYVYSSTAAFCKITAAGSDNGRVFWASKYGGTWSGWNEAPSSFDVLKNIKTITAGSNATFTLANNTKLMLVAIGSVAARMGAWLVFVGSSGSVTAVAIGNDGGNITITTSTNSMTISNTTSGSGSIYVQAIVFDGSIS